MASKHTGSPPLRLAKRAWATVNSLGEYIYQGLHPVYMIRHPATISDEAENDPPPRSLLSTRPTYRTLHDERLQSFMAIRACGTGRR